MYPEAKEGQGLLITARPKKKQILPRSLGKEPALHDLSFVLLCIEDSKRSVYCFKPRSLLQQLWEIDAGNKLASSSVTAEGQSRSDQGQDPGE